MRETPSGRVPLDTEPDGYHGAKVGLRDPARAEFPARTEVFYVNGINTTFADEQRDATRYANLIHGEVRLIHAATRGAARDIETTAAEKLDLALNPPEAAVVTEVLEHLHGSEFQGDVHFMAHSRGALIVQRGLEQVEARLRSEQHLSPAQVRGVMQHVSVETAGGASLGMPPGVRCVHYVDDHDSVANVLGQGRPSRKDVAVLDAVTGALSVVPGVGLDARLGESVYLRLKPVLTHPRGPVVDVPPVPAPRGSGALGDLYANHAIAHYLDHRQPFEPTYAAWAHPHAAAAQRADAHLPDAHLADVQPAAAQAEARAAEASYLADLAGGTRRSHLGSDVQRGVEELAAAGGPRLPSPTSVQPWSHGLAVGSFVALDERTVAQHAGRGAYQVYDVPRDLGGRQPPLGQPLQVAANGTLADPPRSAERELG